MNETYHTLSELDHSISEKIASLKRLIDHLRQDEFKIFKPVRYYPLSEIYNSFKIPNDFDYRARLTKSLKEVGFLEIEGNLSGMKYRLKEGDFKKDSLIIATEINELLCKGKRTYKPRFKHLKTTNSTDLINKDFSSKPVILKKEFSLGDQVYLMNENKIVKGKIIALKYETLSSVSDDYPRIQLPVSINCNNIICNVALCDNSIQTTSTQNVFSDIDILLKSLQVRFLKS